MQEPAKAVIVLAFWWDWHGFFLLSGYRTWTIGWPEMPHVKARPYSLLITHGFVQEHGIPLAEIARHVGVSTSAVSKMLRKAVI